MLKTALAAAVTACTLVAVAGQAQALTVERDVNLATVAARDVDFQNPASVDSFYKKLRVAAREACHSRNPYDRKVVLADRACAEQAVNQAVASLSRPLLTARAQTAGPSPSFARGFN